MSGRRRWPPRLLDRGAAEPLRLAVAVGPLERGDRLTIVGGGIRKAGPGDPDDGTAMDPARPGTVMAERVRRLWWSTAPAPASPGKRAPVENPRRKVAG